MKRILWWVGLSVVGLILWWAALESAEGAVGGVETTGPGVSAGSGAGGAIMDNAGKGTNTTIYGSTNYFDNSAGSNGPISLGVQHGSLNLLIKDLVIGPNAKYFENYSISPGDAGYGQFIVDTTHNGASPSGPNVEIRWVSSSHIAYGPGYGNVAAAHIQFGIGNGQGYGGNNYWGYWQEAQALAQNSATGFSGAYVCKTSELQGANQVDHYAGILGYSIRTNAPGRWAMLFFGELNNGVGSETWDPNTAKKTSVGQFQYGDITNAFFTKPINFATNLGTAAIDCSLPMCDISQAGGTLTFTAPVNFDSQQLQYETPIMFITNSAVGALTLAAPANARLTGTTSVTRQCDVHWYIKIGKYTNGVITQWF